MAHADVYKHSISNDSVINSEDSKFLPDYGDQYCKYYMKTFNSDIIVVKQWLKFVDIKVWQCSYWWQSVTLTAFKDINFKIRW